MMTRLWGLRQAGFSLKIAKPELVQVQKVNRGQSFSLAYRCYVNVLLAFLGMLAYKSPGHQTTMDLIL